MKYSEGSTLETLRRSDAFIAANPGPFIALTGSTTIRELRDTIAQLTAHAAAQEDGSRASRGETSRQQTLRVALRTHHMQGIAAVAKIRLKAVPDFSSLTMPRAKVSTEPLLASAAAMAEASRRHEAVLIDGGLSTDFIARLEAAAETMKESLDGRATFGVRRRGATAGLSIEEQRGRNMIKLLDSQLLPLIGADQALLAAWQTAKRIQRKPGIKIGSTTATTPLPVSTPPVTTSPVATPLVTPPSASEVSAA